MGLGFWASIALLLEHMAVREANCATDEKRKKEKDDNKARRQAKQRARLNRGKWQQGSEEEEEEEDEGDDCMLPVVGAESDQHVNICSFAVRCDRRWPSTQ